MWKLYKVRVYYSGHTHRDIIPINEEVDIEDYLWKRYTEHDIVHDISWDEFTVDGFKITLEVNKDA